MPRPRPGTREGMTAASGTARTGTLMPSASAALRASDTGQVGAPAGGRRSLQPEYMFGGLPVTGNRPLGGSQPDLAVADRAPEGILDLILRVRDVAAVILRPQVLHCPWAAAKFQRNQVVFLIVVQALVAVPVLDNLLALQPLGVALRRPYRPSPPPPADGLADVPLRHLRVGQPGRAVPVGQAACAVTFRRNGRRAGGRDENGLTQQRHRHERNDSDDLPHFQPPLVMWKRRKDARGPCDPAMSGT